MIYITLSTNPHSFKDLRMTKSITMVLLIALFATTPLFAKEPSFHIQLWGNPFYSQQKDETDHVALRKSIPATIELGFGRNVQFLVGFGMKVTESSNTDGPSQWDDTLVTGDIQNSIESLSPFNRRLFKINTGLSHKLKEESRFRLNMIHDLSVFIISDDILTIELEGSSTDFTVWRQVHNRTNFQYFLGLEPTLNISKNFSISTRSGLSLLWLDDNENIRFYATPHAFYGGLGFNYSF